MLNSQVRIDEEILKTTKKSRISQIINTDHIQRNTKNIHENAVKDIQDLIKKQDQGLSVFFNQKVSLVYILNRNYISVFSFNEDENQRLYQKIVPELPGKLIQNAPIFYKTSQQLLIIVFTKTQIYIKSLFDKKNEIVVKQKITDKTEEIIQAVLMKQDDRFCYIKILDSNFMLKEIQISNKGSITVNKSLKQFQNKRRTIFQGIKSFLISATNKNQECDIRYAKLLYARSKDQKITTVIQNNKIMAFFEGSKNYFFQFKELNVAQFIQQHEQNYLQKNSLDLYNVQLCDIILLQFDQIKPLFACVYTLHCRSKVDYNEFTSCKLGLFYYQPSQLTMSQHYVLSENRCDRTYITDYLLMTQYNFDNNNDPVVRTNSNNNKIFVILKYYSLHDIVRESNLFEIDLDKNKIVHKLINDEIYGGGVIFGAIFQNNYNFFVLNNKRVMFFDDCNGLKLRQLQSRNSLPFIDEEHSRVIYPESLQTSLIEQSQLRINENENQDFIQDSVFQYQVQQGFKNYIDKNCDEITKNEILRQIKTKSEEANYQISLEKIIGNIFEKQSFRITTATRIEREDLIAVYAKHKEDPSYLDAISTDLMIKLKELNKFYEFLLKLDLDQNYKESYVFNQRCIFMCQNIITFRNQQLQNIEKQDIQKFLNKCIKKLFNKKYTQNPDYLYANLLTFNNIYDQINQQLLTNFNQDINSINIISFVAKVYLEITQLALENLHNKDNIEKNKVMPKRSSNVFQYCISFLELIMKRDSSQLQKFQIKYLEKLQETLMQILIILKQEQKIEKPILKQYVKLLFEYKINDENCFEYFQLLQQCNFIESQIQILFHFNIPNNKIDLKKDLKEEQFKLLLKQIIGKSINILKKDNLNHNEITQVRKVYKILEPYSIEVSEILQDINQPYLYSLFVQNFANDNFLKFFPQNSQNRKLNNLIKVIDLYSGRDQFAVLQNLDYLIQKYQLLQNNQNFDLQILVQNLIKKSSALNLSILIQIIDELRKKYISDEENKQIILNTLIEILIIKTTNMKNSQHIVKRLIQNLDNIKNLSQNLPNSEQLQKFIYQIGQLSLINNQFSH